MRSVCHPSLHLAGAITFAFLVVATPSVVRAQRAQVATQAVSAGGSLRVIQPRNYSVADLLARVRTLPNGAQVLARIPQQELSNGRPQLAERSASIANDDIAATLSAFDHMSYAGGTVQLDLLKADVSPLPTPSVTLHPGSSPADGAAQLVFAANSASQAGWYLVVFDVAYDRPINSYASDDRQASKASVRIRWGDESGIHGGELVQCDARTLVVTDSRGVSSCAAAFQVPGGTYTFTMFNSGVIPLRFVEASIARVR